MLGRIVSGAAVVALVAAGSAVGSGTARPAQACDDTVASAAAIACQVNAARTAAGLAPLSADPRLASAAQQHAQAMVTGGAPFSVSSPITAVERVREAGFPLVNAVSASEVVGDGSGPPQSSPSSVVRQWLANGDNRAILLGPAFTLAGVGAVTGVPGDPSSGATYDMLVLDDGSNNRAAEVGKSVLIAPVSGVVTFTPPGGAPTQLTGAKVIPVGATIDTTHGRMRLTAALPGTAAAVRSQTADFYGGALTVAQSRQTGLTTLTLAGSFSVCKATKATAAAGRGAQVRHLWGNGKGSFSTHARFAAATVRGTIWLTTDYCAGTLVKVVRGAVRVKNLVTGASVLVKPGHPYFAAAKPRH